MRFFIIFAKQIETKIIAFFVSEQNAKMKRNGREKCENFTKRFFLFAGNPSLLRFQDPTQLICGFYSLQCFNCFRCLLLYSRYKFSCKQNYKNIYTRCFRNNNQRKLIMPSVYKFGLSVCLFVCLYSINVRTAEPIGPKFFVGHHVTTKKVYE